MNNIKKLICLLLSLLIAFSLFACAKPEKDAPEKESTANDEEPSTPEESDKVDSEENNEGEDEELPPAKRKGYSVRYESELSDDAQISSVHATFSGQLYPFELSVMTENGKTLLVDYSGNIRADLPSTDDTVQFHFCPVCLCITDHAVKVDPITLEITEHFMGHGYSGSMYYYYDEERGLLFNDYIGGYAQPAPSTDGAFVVCRLSGREATEAEKLVTGSDIYYEPEKKYGILVDGELVVGFEYDGGTNFYGGMCTLSKDGKWGCFDDEGNMLFDTEYSAIGSRASYGLIPLCKDGMWAYGNTDGRHVTEFEFESACDVYRGLAWVKQDGKWKVIEFLKYDKGITEFEAQQSVEEMLYSSGHYVSISVDPLPKEERITYYGSEGYCFSTEVMTKAGTVITDMCYFVLPDGTMIIYRID